MIDYGSLVVLVTPKGRRHIKLLEEGQSWHCSDGCLSHEEIAALDYGSIAITSGGAPVRLEEATLYDRLMGLKRQTQIIYPKDIAHICMRLGRWPGQDNPGSRLWFRRAYNRAFLVCGAEWQNCEP